MNWRESRWPAWIEGALVAALVAGHEFVPVSATPFFLLLGWASLRRRGLTWRDVGLVRKHSWLVTLGVGTLAGVAMELFSTYVSVPFFSGLADKPPELSELRPLVGNAPLVLIALVASWLLAAFGEEMVFRGYLMNRGAGLLGGTRQAWAVSLLVVSALFGACHEAQGLTGIVQEGLAGLLLGLLYLACGRTLAIPIVAHGMSNSLALLLIYLDRYPGV